MEYLDLALQLALIAKRDFVIQTSDYEACVKSLKYIATEGFGIEDIVEVDLKELDVSFEAIAESIVNSDLMVYSMIIWRNLENVELDFERKRNLLRVFDQLSRYGKVSSRNKDTEPFQLGNRMVRKPSLCICIPVIVNGAHMPRIDPQVKSRFIFSQLYYPIKNDSIAFDTSREDILSARSRADGVYVKATVEEYASSLFVFTRSHRLCSLAPLSSRPPLSARENVILLAKALVLARSTDDERFFVTPEHIKIAYRKVAQWLVDWETNPIFNGTNEEEDYRRKMEISMLTGDWFGSEWKHVESYLKQNASAGDPNSTTGFTNPLVEDVLMSVQPPI